MQEPPEALAAPNDVPAGLVHDLLPHEGRALLLTAVRSRSIDRAEATVLIGPEHPYVVDGAAESTLALELFAQTAALVSALEGAAPRRGRLAAVPELELDQEFVTVGTELVVTVTREGDHGLLTRFAGVLSAGGALVARGVIVVALTDEVAPTGSKGKEP